MFSRPCQQASQVIRVFEDIGRRPDQRADQDVYSSRSAKWVIFLLGWKDNYCQLRGEYVSGPGETKQTIVYISYHGHQSMHFNFTVSIVLTERRAESSYWVFISRKYWSLKWKRRELLVLHCQRDRRTGGVLFVLIWQLQWDWGHGTVLATNHQSSLEAPPLSFLSPLGYRDRDYRSTHTGHHSLQLTTPPQSSASVSMIRT